MNKEELVELANKLYKITLLFPKKEPLRYKMREKADEILEGFIALEVFHRFNPKETVPVDNSKRKDLIFEIEKDLEVIRSYFEIAKWQNWLNYFDVLEIQEKYDKIEGDFKKEIQALEYALYESKLDIEQEKSLKIEFPKADRKQLSSVNTETKTQQTSLDSRKEKILEILKEKDKVQVWQVKEVFPQITKRTLRRDFEKLLKQGLIERVGERNETFYILKKQEI